MALKAYQLGVVSGFLGQEQYIDESDGRDFATLLYGEICGADLDDCFVFFDRYFEEEGDGKMKMVSDVMDYITHEGVIDYSAGFTLPMYEFVLWAGVTSTVAQCFGDTKRAQEILEGLAEWIQDKKSQGDE